MVNKDIEKITEPQMSTPEKHSFYRVLKYVKPFNRKSVGERISQMFGDLRKMCKVSWIFLQVNGDQ